MNAATIGRSKMRKILCFFGIHERITAHMISREFCKHCNANLD